MLARSVVPSQAQHSRSQRPLARPGGRSSGRWRSIRSAAAAVSLAVVVLHATAFGCLPGRFPVCKTNDDCKEAEGKICANLRCAQCQGDSDCGEGRYCESKLNECKSLGGPKGAEPSVIPPEPDLAAPPASASASASASPKPKK